MTTGRINQIAIRRQRPKPPRPRSLSSVKQGLYRDRLCDYSSRGGVTASAGVIQNFPAIAVPSTGSIEVVQGRVLGGVPSWLLDARQASDSLPPDMGVTDTVPCFYTRIAHLDERRPPRNSRVVKSG